MRQRREISGVTAPRRRTMCARRSTSPAGKSLLQCVAIACGRKPSQWRPTSIRSASTRKSKSASWLQPENWPEPRTSVEPEWASSRSHDSPLRSAVNAADTSLIANGSAACSKRPDSSWPATAKEAASSASSAPDVRHSRLSRPRRPVSHSGAPPAAGSSDCSRGEISSDSRCPVSSKPPPADNFPSKPARSKRSAATVPRITVPVPPEPSARGRRSIPMFRRVSRVPNPAPSTSKVASSTVTGTGSPP